MLMRRFLIVCALSALATRAVTAQQVYRRAVVDSAGRLRIERADHRVIEPSKDSAQVGFDQPAVSRDHRTVGWLALYPNCCTTYPIPLELVLLRANGRRTTIAADLPIWQWGFASDGRSVVLRQAPVHGAAPETYERRDITTGRVTATAVADSQTPAVLPAWVRDAISGAHQPPLQQ
jgi:hypothetical protein